ncbi:hypothetical protein HCN44_000659 [Aphidius gifuensis]|uniref:Uncharacterized protein n=1 Tax=Aphidius gifuensis TaxID=684658 RepID=A0A835CNI4_APHGI|nr:hypothetical protein HCN44_000659 [Aphidius gifuensis]
MGDPSVDPCDDFYQFACGGFLKSTNPYGLVGSLKYEELTKKYKQRLGIILKQKSSINEPKYLKLAKTLNRLCGSEDYSKILKSLESRGGWPVLTGSQWNESKIDLTKIYHYFFQITWSNGRIEVSPRPSRLSVEDFVQGRNNINVNNYYNEMIEIVERMGAAKNNIDYRDDVDKILDFEIELGRKRLSTEEKLYNRDTSYMTLNELTNGYLFFSNIQTRLSSLGFDQKSSSYIYILNYSYLKKFQRLLKSTGIKRTLANYIMLKDVKSMLKNNDNVIKRENCNDLVLSKLPHAVAAISVQNYNQFKLMKTRNDILNMTLRIKKKFFEIIKMTNWIDEETRNTVIEKFKSTTYLIGCIDELTNNSKINEFYKSLKLFNYDSFDDATAKINQFNVQYENITNGWIFFIKQMQKTPAAYHLSSNSIFVSCMILLSDYFDSKLPNHMNYASLGFAIGHEIVHGYDNTGRLYIRKNRYVDLWTPWSSRNFNDTSQCIIEQYSNYVATETGSRINGSIALGENIADLGGVRATYRAYKELSNTDSQLPNLPYTPKQLFWISFASMYCEKTYPYYPRDQVNISHAPGVFRIVNSLSNLPEFANDFRCQSGSKMNPFKKCSVW